MIKLKYKLLASLLSISLITIALTGCSSSKSTTTASEPISKTEVLMGTPCKITIYDKKDDAIMDKVFARIKEIESEVSINEKGTEVDKINAASGKNSVKVGTDTYNLIKAGIKYSELTGGSFDITIGPIVNLWRIGFDDARVPSQKEIDNALPLVGYKNLEVNDADKSIFLKKKGMVIDLGGIAKGFVADEVAKVLSDNGVKKAIIDLGGNILAMGSNTSNNPWVIGIQNPFENDEDVVRGDIIGTLKETNKSIVTSGIYERYLEKNGKKYHHMLSPFDGYPFNNELVSVTIVSDKSTDGDGLSTSTFSKGLEGGLKFIEGIKGVEAIFITKDNKIYITSGLKGNFKVTNSDFKLMN